MSPLTTSFLFPDVNVWLALVVDVHVHHAAAAKWYDSTGSDSRIFFCRFTQLALLRLLTNSAVMSEEVLDQQQAWSIYDRVLDDDRISLVDEPAHIERIFRSTTRQKLPATKDWTDSYLIAFAEASGFRIITFDHVLAGKSSCARLLRV
jgi:uncharacterized protein